MWSLTKSQITCVLLDQKSPSDKRSFPIQLRQHNTPQALAHHPREFNHGMFGSRIRSPGNATLNTKLNPTERIATWTKFRRWFLIVKNGILWNLSRRHGKYRGHWKKVADAPPGKPSISTTQIRHYHFTLRMIAKVAFLGSLELVKGLVMLENRHLELSSDYTISTSRSFLNKRWLLTVHYL